MYFIGVLCVDRELKYFQDRVQIAKLSGYDI